MDMVAMDTVVTVLPAMDIVAMDMVPMDTVVTVLPAMDIVAMDTMAIALLAMDTANLATVPAATARQAMDTANLAMVINVYIKSRNKINLGTKKKLEVLCNISFL